MKAMIFAAGLGTRLRPITNDKPKAMAPIKGIPMLEIVIRRLAAYGFNELIVNVHHYPDMIIDFLKKNKNFGIRIEVSDERDELLDTGGGLKKAAWFFDDGQPFLVHNVDTLTNVNLTDFMTFHKKNSALASLLVRHRPGSRYFLFDDTFRLCGWRNTQTKEEILARTSTPSTSLHQIAFSCLHIIDPKIFAFLKEEGKFSIVQSYLRLAGAHNIAGYVDDDSYWLDIGTPTKLQQGTREIDPAKFVLRN